MSGRLGHYRLFNNTSFVEQWNVIFGNIKLKLVFEMKSELATTFLLLATFCSLSFGQKVWTFWTFLLQSNVAFWKLIDVHSYPSVFTTSPFVLIVPDSWGINCIQPISIWKITLTSNSCHSENLK